MIAHYIIFHPDRERVQVAIRGNVLIDNQFIEEWEGTIWSDKRKCGKHNEDPFIYDIRWAYSYCHATQLSRANKRNAPFLQEGSVIFFCSGNQIDKDVVSIDTVFFVERAYKWKNDQTGPQLPAELINYFNDNSSPFWARHLKFPFQNEHYTPKKGNYIYISPKFNYMKTKNYSYLPLKEDGIRTSFPINFLSNNLVSIINQKKVRKRPVPLSVYCKIEVQSFARNNCRVLHFI